MNFLGLLHTDLKSDASAILIKAHTVGKAWRGIHPSIVMPRACCRLTASCAVVRTHGLHQQQLGLLHVADAVSVNVLVLSPKGDKESCHFHQIIKLVCQKLLPLSYQHKKVSDTNQLRSTSNCYCSRRCQRQRFGLTSQRG